MNTAKMSRRSIVAGGLVLAAAPARAADKIRVAKAITSSFPFAGLELGKEQGFWAAEGFDIEIIAFAGDGRMQQAFGAGGIDFGVGSGPGMGYAVKGVPARAVAALAGAPRNMALLVTNNSPVKSIDDLKGRTVGVTTAGALTDWLTRRMSADKGWGPDGIQVVPLGETRARLAAMKNGELAASVNSIEEALAVQERGEGKMLATFGDAVPDFHTHVIFASDSMIQKSPDTVRRFLRAWFRTAAFMRDNREATIKSVAKTMGNPETVVAAAYPEELKMLSFDGAFSTKAVEVIRASLKDLGIVDSVPELKAMFTTEFSPLR
jgi:NitT/TauT family transport system substrate-binding protein